MYAVEVRDHIMIAHSFADPYFGPAQNMHGATFIVDVTFFRPDLTPQNVVVDIGRAHEVVKGILQPINYANLDALPQFQGVLTTTEFLCRHIYDQLLQAVKSGALGPEAQGLTAIRVTLHESHVARAWFEGPAAA